MIVIDRVVCLRHLLALPHILFAFLALITVNTCRSDSFAYVLVCVFLGMLGLFDAKVSGTIPTELGQLSNLGESLCLCLFVCVCVCV